MQHLASSPARDPGAAANPCSSRRRGSPPSDPESPFSLISTSDFASIFADRPSLVILFDADFAFLALIPTRRDPLRRCASRPNRPNRTATWQANGAASDKRWIRGGTAAPRRIDAIGIPLDRNRGCIDTDVLPRDRAALGLNAVPDLAAPIARRAVDRPF